MCDIDGCENEALFFVGAWGEIPDQLEDQADVCGAPHAAQWVKSYLRDFAAVEDEA
jgi:hypothetical protein